MWSKMLLLSAVLAILCSAASGQRLSGDHRDHSQWLVNIMGRIGEIQPGMTRRALLKIFAIDGGIYSKSRQTFILKACPILHVDVKFAFPPGAGVPFTETLDDKIVTISKPYLDGRHYD